MLKPLPHGLPLGVVEQYYNEARSDLCPLSRMRTSVLLFKHVFVPRPARPASLLLPANVFPISRRL